jgi:23S rRNA (cytosine1962-C5)-methyltransferase
VNWETGQKTGFFLDQRDNRQLLGTFAKGKSVLNTFCYSGGFSIYALNQNAIKVDSIDASKKAMEWTDKNVELNQNSNLHESFTGDVMKFFKEDIPDYDMMIVDPPAFAKSIKKRHNAVQGYKRLNAAALKKIKPGGILFTFSCSQVVSRELFYNTITAAAIEARRHVKVMKFLSQPADHPISLFHPEGEYLKGLVLYVE